MTPRFIELHERLDTMPSAAKAMMVNVEDIVRVQDLADGASKSGACVILRGAGEYPPLHFQVVESIADMAQLLRHSTIQCGL